MTDRNFGFGRSEANRTGVFRWKNTSSETVPAFGCIKLSEYNSAGDYYEAVKPDGNGNLHFFNGPIPVAVDAFGESRIWGAASVLGLTSAAFGDTVGPSDDSWEMGPGGSGFTVFSDPDPITGLAAILRDGGGGDGSKIIAFAIISSDQETRSALVEIRQRTFTGTVYGSDLDDTVVRVYDTDGCYLNEPNVDLTGRLGKATLMRVDDEARETHFQNDSYPPEWYWNTLTVCCPSAICEQADE